MSEHLENASDVSVILQIEDPEGVEAIDEIAAVEGVSACFVGRADLAVAYGVYDLDAPEVTSAVESVIKACATRGVPVATFVPKMEDARAWFERGVNMVAVASEHKPMQEYFSKGSVSSVKVGDE